MFCKSLVALWLLLQLSGDLIKLASRQSSASLSYSLSAFPSSLLFLIWSTKPAKDYNGFTAQSLLRCIWKVLSAAQLYRCTPRNTCTCHPVFAFTISSLWCHLYSCLGRGKQAFQPFQFRVDVLTLDKLVQSKKTSSW